MTVSNTVSSVTFTGNGLTTVFPYTFLIPANGDAEVVVYDSVTMTEITLTVGVDCTISGIGSALGGNVTYNPSGVPLPATKNITIRREVALTQTLDLTRQSNSDPTSLEAELDRMVMMIQQISTTLDETALTIPAGSGLDTDDVFAAAVAASASAAAAAASAIAAAAAVASVTAGLGLFLQDSGTADALVITPAPAIAGYVDGQMYLVRKGAAANATTTPTLNVNAKGAITIKKRVAGALTALVAGDMQAVGDLLFEYNAAGVCMVLTNPTIASTSFVLKAGDTMTGGLTVLPAAGDSVIAANKATSGNAAGVFGKKAGLNRWGMLLGDANAESAGNAGSYFTLIRYDDAGAQLDFPLQMQRNDDRFFFLKGQISFPAVQNASSDANTLDDYEKGTFTATLAGTTAAGAGTYSVQTGKYVKIGRLVVVEIALTWSAHTGTGNMLVSGCPFTPFTAATIPATIVCDNLTFGAGTLIARSSGTSTSSIALLLEATGAAQSAVAMDTAAGVNLTMTYQV